MVDVSLACSPGGPKAGPVARTIFGRNDEVERLADSLGGPVSEQGLGGRIPDTDDAGGLCANKCGCGLCHATTPAEDAFLDPAHACDRMSGGLRLGPALRVAEGGTSSAHAGQPQPPPTTPRAAARSA